MALAKKLFRGEGQKGWGGHKKNRFPQIVISSGVLQWRSGPWDNVLSGAPPILHNLTPLTPPHTPLPQTLHKFISYMSLNTRHF